MSVCWLNSLDGSTILILDATQTIQYSRTVDVSTNTIFNGSKISDNVCPQLPVVTFTGISTYMKTRKYYPSPTEYRYYIDELIDSQEVFTFNGSDDWAFPSLNNCCITSFTADRKGTSWKDIEVSITIRQLDISTAATATTISTSSSSTKKTTDEGQNDSSSDTSSGSTTDYTLTGSLTSWLGSVL